MTKLLVSKVEEFNFPARISNCDKILDFSPRNL